jgi:hypothetical protein
LLLKIITLTKQVITDTSYRFKYQLAINKKINVFVRDQNTYVTNSSRCSIMSRTQYVYVWKIMFGDLYIYV